MTSLNIEKLKQKLEYLKNPKLHKGKFEKKTWSPEAGKVKTIRMFHAPALEDPVVELHFHYGISRGGILCPRMMEGTECPVCEFGFELRKSKDEADKQAFKSMMPRQRFFIAMVDREDSTLTPKWWGFGKSIYMEILQALTNDEYSNFLDPMAGIDATVEVIEKGGEDKFATPKMTFKRKDSKLAETPEDIGRIMSALPSITEIYKPYTKQELKAALNAYLNPEPQEGSEQVKGPSEEKETSEYTDLNEAFEKALQE